MTLGELNLVFTIVIFLELTYLVISRYIGLRGLGKSILQRGFVKKVYPKRKCRRVVISDTESSSSSSELDY
jgi:hypothetical protein